MTEKGNELIAQILEVVTTYGLNVVGAIAILIVGWMAAGWISRAVGRAMGRMKKVDETLQGFFQSLTRYAVIVFTILAVLAQFGIQTTSFIAVLGAAGLALGLALQGTLSHLAAGVMLLMFRPFKVGDFVETGSGVGVVDAITLFFTEMHTPDNVQVIVPNGQLWNTAIKNYSHHSTRRVDIVMGISYEDNIDKAMTVIQNVIGAESRVLAEPEAMTAVGELADNSVNIIVRVWCAAEDYWPLKFDLTKHLKERFDTEGISIPYPQRTVHLLQS
jgi:small conductance mechanosensitive channel